LFSLYFANRLKWLSFSWASNYRGGSAEIRFEGVAPLPNPLHPELMTPAERLEEIAEILAAGILRLRARLSAPRGSTGEQVRVDFSPGRSSHVASSGRRRRRT
jgi:hypothetical protein